MKQRSGQTTATLSTSRKTQAIARAHSRKPPLSETLKSAVAAMMLFAIAQLLAMQGLNAMLGD